MRLEVEAPDHPCLAEADVRRVERVVRNLVTNAIDHAHPDGERSTTALVLIRVAGDDQAAAIAVRDYGVGLAPGESAMVFNRFWRADPARARTSGGTGLGLSISMEDTHLHGGWLQAWGRPGRGLAVPAHPAAAGRRLAAPEPAAPRPRRRPGAGPMRRRTAARASAWAALAAACLVLTGCGVAMPHSGPVRETTLAGSDRDELPPNIDPPRPTKGASREEIVAGFLDAMTATPAVRTSVAREYLTKEASDTWQPSGMLIYREPLSPRGNNPIEQQFIDAYRTDARGAWLGPATAAQATVEFPMELEDGEWRISQPPPNLLVPQTWFEPGSAQVSLYFFDPSHTMLIPEPVFVPRGPQFASALVTRCWPGPPTSSPGWSRAISQRPALARVRTGLGRRGGTGRPDQ